jgi:hypothetical protein
MKLIRLMLIVFAIGFSTNSNALTTMGDTRRMVARQIDDDLTEPHIRRYYTWILMYVKEEEKGDFRAV